MSGESKAPVNLRPWLVALLLTAGVSGGGSVLQARSADGLVTEVRVMAAELGGRLDVMDTNVNGRLAVMAKDVEAVGRQAKANAKKLENCECGAR